MADDNLEQSETVKAWADITIKTWESKIAKYKIGSTFTLVHSFLNHAVTAANGNILMVQFLFKYYGRFVDMGVGKGTRIFNENSRESQALASKGHSISNIARQYQNQFRTPRKKKPWYSPVFYAQVHRLGEILAKKYAQKAAIAIVENVDDNAMKWEKQWTRL